MHSAQSQPRRGRIPNVTFSLGRCTACEKQSYRSRKDAKRVARIAHPGEHLDAFPCRSGTGTFHIGHYRPGLRDHHRHQRTEGRSTTMCDQGCYKVYRNGK